MYLETRRLILRHWEEGDAEDYINMPATRMWGRSRAGRRIGPQKKAAQ